MRADNAPEDAALLAEEALAAIQGGLTMARALDDPRIFQRVLARTTERLTQKKRPNAQGSVLGTRG